MNIDFASYDKKVLISAVSLMFLGLLITTLNVVIGYLFANLSVFIVGTWILLTQLRGKPQKAIFVLGFAVSILHILMMAVAAFSS